MEATKKTPKIRELFIDELAGVQGGSPTIRELIEKVTGGCCASTMACCEEGDCCADPWAVSGG